MQYLRLHTQIYQWEWEFQDPKMEVLYHIRPYFAGDIPLHRPYIGLIYGRYLQFRILKWPLNIYIYKTTEFTKLHQHSYHKSAINPMNAMKCHEIPMFLG